MFLPYSLPEMHPEIPRANTVPVPLPSGILAYSPVSCPVGSAPSTPPSTPVYVSSFLSGHYRPFIRIILQYTIKVYPLLLLIDNK